MWARSIPKGRSNWSEIFHNNLTFQQNNLSGEHNAEAAVFNFYDDAKTANTNNNIRYNNNKKRIRYNNNIYTMSS